MPFRTPRVPPQVLFRATGNHLRCAPRVPPQATLSRHGKPSLKRTKSAPLGYSFAPLRPCAPTPNPHFKPGRRDVTCMRAHCGARIHTSYVHSHLVRAQRTRTHQHTTTSHALDSPTRHHVAPLPLRPVAAPLAVAHGHFVN